jgi:hypothetical protein
VLPLEYKRVLAAQLEATAPRKAAG